MENYTKEQYDKDVISLNEKHLQERYDLARKYAYANNPHKEGNIITDHIGSIKIERIGLEYSRTNSPSCIYVGIELKKDLTPKKNSPKRQVWQSNLIKD